MRQTRASRVRRWSAPSQVYNLSVRALLVTLALLTAQTEPTRVSFSEWLDGVRKEALARGIRQEVVDEALGHVDEPVTVVIERDRAQAEAVFSLERYLSRQLTARRIKTGRERYEFHRELLDQVGARYGVRRGSTAGSCGMWTRLV